jgi:hypothetical protein
MRIKKFDQWVSEDFAAVGIAPEGNVIGMGNATPPSANSYGSGDAWPSLGSPVTQTGSPKKKRRKKKKKKVNEGSSDLHHDSDISYIEDAILTGAANDKSVSDKDWLDFFDATYTVDAADFLSSTNTSKLREMFSHASFHVWVCFDWETPTEVSNIEALKKDGWEILAQSKEGPDGHFAMTRIAFKQYTDKEIEENYQEVLDEIRTNHKLSKKEFDWLFSTLTPEDKEKYAGTATGKQYGV